jgi:hypothetical protein
MLSALIAAMHPHQSKAPMSFHSVMLSCPFKSCTVLNAVRPRNRGDSTNAHGTNLTSHRPRPGQGFWWRGAGAAGRLRPPGMGDCSEEKLTWCEIQVCLQPISYADALTSSTSLLSMPSTTAVGKLSQMPLDKNKARSKLAQPGSTRRHLHLSPHP